MSFAVSGHYSLYTKLDASRGGKKGLDLLAIKVQANYRSGDVAEEPVM